MPWPEEGAGMARKQYTAEEIIGKLREADVAFAGGASVPEAVRRLGVSAPFPDLC